MEVTTAIHSVVVMIVVTTAIHSVVMMVVTTAIFGGDKNASGNSFSRSRSNSISPGTNPWSQTQNEGSSSFPGATNPWSQKQTTKNLPFLVRTVETDNHSNKHLFGTKKVKPICRYWKATGTCKFGDKCHYRHEVSSQQGQEDEEEEKTEEEKTFRCTRWTDVYQKTISSVLWRLQGMECCIDTTKEVESECICQEFPTCCET